MSATHALTLSATLTKAAAAQAADMAANNYMGHRGSDGSEVGERVTRTGYRWSSVGENVAAGQPDAETVVKAWLDSPGHCENIMGPQFREMGVAFVAGAAERPAHSVGAGLRGAALRVVGPVGLEPTTKGFTLPAVSGGSGLSLHPSSCLGWGAGRSRLSLRALKLSGSLCTVRRCTAGLAQGCRRASALRFP